jgi:serine/threonine protein kinase
MEQYEVVEQIGRGAYGTAYLVHHRDENKKRYVMKKIRLSKQNDKFQRTAYQEVKQSPPQTPSPSSCSSKFRFRVLLRRTFLSLPVSFG